MHGTGLAGFNGILWEKVETIKETGFRFDVAWGLFSFEIKTGQADIIYNSEDGIFQWQDPELYKESNWLYKIR